MLRTGKGFSTSICCIQVAVEQIEVSKMLHLQSKTRPSNLAKTYSTTGCSLSYILLILFIYVAVLLSYWTSLG